MSQDWSTKGASRQDGAKPTMASLVFLTVGSGVWIISTTGSSVVVIPPNVREEPFGPSLLCLPVYYEVNVGMVVDAPLHVEYSVVPIPSMTQPSVVLTVISLAMVAAAPKVMVCNPPRLLALIRLAFVVATVSVSVVLARAAYIHTGAPTTDPVSERVYACVPVAVVQERVFRP